jgi:isoleucyl-tRNA synthetase
LILLVSQVTLVEGDSFAVRVDEAEGVKCERCWHYTVDVGADPAYPTACRRCVGHLREIVPPSGKE